MRIEDLLTKIRLISAEATYVAQRAMSPPKAVRNSTSLIQLEDRVMFSATALPAMVVAEMTENAVTAQSMEAPASESPPSSEWDLGVVEAAADAPENQGVSQDSADTVAPVSELLIVDSALPDYEKLLDNLDLSTNDERHFSVVLLDPERDGIDQITEALRAHDNLNAVHIVSHSSPGSIRLGNSVLTASNIINYNGQISDWRDALASDSDLLVYGCDLAASEHGRTLLDSLAALCDCDVAASDDVTGHRLLGGDWDLEFQIGTVDTAPIFDVTTTDSWVHRLANSIAVTTTADAINGDTSSFDNLLLDDGGDGISLREAMTAANTQAGADTITFNLDTEDSSYIDPTPGSPGSGDEYWTIGVSSALPQITDTLTLDGTTQNGWVAGSFQPVVIDGNDNSSGIQFSTDADGSVIRGLVVRDFDADAVDLLDGADNITVAGNWIGSFNSDGTDAGGGEVNAYSGVRARGDNVTIGGSTLADRNVFSGNTFGVLLRGTATGTTVSGNFIGTDTTGNGDGRSNDYGIQLSESANNVTIGGATAAHGNVIANANVNPISHHE